MKKNYISLNMRSGSVFTSEKLEKSELLSSLLSNLFPFSWLGSLLLIFSFLTSQNGWAQVASYTFSQSTGTYTPITGGTVSGFGALLDDNIFSVTLPTAFLYNGNNITTVGFNANGYLIMGNTTTHGYVPISSTATSNGVIAAMGMDLVANSASSDLRWEQIGNEIIFQWNDFKRYNSTAFTNENFSFQIRLNVVSRVITIVYNGSTNVNTSITRIPQVGLRGTLNSDYNARRLTTSVPDAVPAWNDTAAATSNAHNVRFTSTGTCYPAAGQTFAWTPPTPPSCGVPLSLSVTDVQTTTADLNWATPASGTPASYDWEIRTTGAGGSGATGLTTSGNVTAPIVTVNDTPGLAEGTAYNLYVRTNCTGGDGSSTWAGPVAFTTRKSCPGGLGVGSVTIASLPYSATGLTNSGAGNNVTSTNVACVAGSANYYGAEDKTYIFTPSISGVYTIVLTTATDDDAGIMLYQGCPFTTGSTCVANAQSTTGLTRTLAPTLTAGLTYYLLVDNWTAPAFINSYSLSISLPPSCGVPTGLSVSDLTFTTTDLAWVAPNTGTPASYDWEIRTTGAGGSGATGLTTSGNVTAPTITVNDAAGLSPSTSYNLYVRTNCIGGDGSSTWAGPVAFTTPCAPITVFPSTFDFATYLPSVCWREGDLGNLTTGPATIGGSTVSDWAVDGFLNVGSTGAAKMNIDAATGSEWLLTPFYTIPTNGYRVKYSVGATNWGATTAVTNWEADDFVELLVSTSNANWTILKTYNASNVPSNLGQIDEALLAAYSGQTVQFAFRAFEGASDGSADIDFFIDNFVVEIIPNCGSPSSLSVSDLTFTTADLAWVAPIIGTPASYDWEIRTTGAGGSGATGLVNSGNVVAPTVTVDNATGLAAGTAYNLYVRTNCTGGDGSSTWAGPSAFSTPTPGESCATAATITVAPNLGAAVNTLLTTGLTSDGPAGTCSDATGNPSKKDRWVAFVAPSSGNKVIVSTVSGSITDAVMQVWSSCPATGVALGCSDDVIGFMPQLEFCSLTPGATYYIQIWPYSATATGNFNVRVYEEAACPVPPSNDECAGVQTITVGAAGSCPDTATAGTTVNATATPGVVKTTCDPFGTYNDVFYKFNSGSNTEINFAFTNLTGTNEFGIYSACGTGFLGACSSSSLTTTYTGLTANTDYYIVVWANSAVTAGTFSICISQVPAPLCVTAPTSPANAGTVCAGTTNFSWPAVTSATSYDVFLDNVLVSDNQTGTTYSQVVAPGAHTWSVIPSNSTGSATGCSTFTFTSSSSPVGNTFATAIDLGALTNSTTVNGNNLSTNCFTDNFTTSSTPSSANARTANDVFYKFEITQCGASVTIGTCTSSFDTYIHLLNASGASITFDDDDCTTPNSSGSLLDPQVLAVGVYYVVVEGFDTEETGTFTLNIAYSSGTAQTQYFADVDNDTYGVTNDFIIACAPTGNYTALVGGDCNDGNAAINPGALDICFDGIDNDCSGTASNTCTIAVNMTPALQGTTLAGISTTMSAVPYTYPGAQTQGYRFLITNKSASPNVSVELQSTSRFFSLTQAGIAAYSSEFEIKATAVINGQLVEHSGNTITVFTPAAPVIPMSSFTCGTQLSRLNATISAASAFGAVAYRFRIRLTSDTQNPTYGYSQSSSRFVGASSFLKTDNSPFVLQYINSYQVAVQYLLLNNGVEAWTEFGSECTVTTPAIPLIALASPSCGSQVSSNGATISAQAAANANQYRFRIRLTSDTVNPNYGYTLPNASRFSQLSAFVGFTLTPSTSYSLAVEYRLMNNGQEVWSGFGTECVIISAGSNILIRPEAPIETVTETTNNLLNAIAYPNPFRDSFNLEIKPIAATPIQIVVYDMTGRLLESKSLTVDQANSTPIGSNYPSGVYQVVVSQESQVQTVRVIKQ